MSVCKHRLGSISKSLGGVAPAVREGIRSLLPRWQSAHFPAAGRATQHSTPNSEYHWMYPLELHFAAARTYGAKEVQRKGRQGRQKNREREQIQQQDCKRLKCCSSSSPWAGRVRKYRLNEMKQN